MKDETGISIEVQTREHVKEGKLLFSEFAKYFKDAPTLGGQVIAIGVMENGTESGKPSVMILTQFFVSDENGNPQPALICSELTGQNFLVGSQMANEHISKFLRKCNQTALKEMT